MQAAGLDGIELQAYGHLMDQFWSPLTNDARRPLRRRQPRQPPALHLRHAAGDPRAGAAPDFIVGVRYTGDEDLPGGLTNADGLEISRRLKASGMVDFLNVVKGHIDTDAGLTDVIPVQGMRSAPHLDFAGEIRAATDFPTFHAAKIQDVATARHAIASGKLDIVGMTRAHMADPHIVAKIDARRGGAHPPLRRRELLPRPDLPGRHGALPPQPLHGARAGTAARDRQGRHAARVVVVGAGPAGLEAARVAAAARPRGDRARGGERSRRADPPDRADRAAARDDADRSTGAWRNASARA